MTPAEHPQASDSNYRQRLGRWGEEAARRYLEERGVKILAANQRTSYGEIDLVGMQDGTLVFFEVKTRRSTSYGFPEQAVDEKKREHMRNAALDYLQQQGMLEAEWRIDVLAVEKRRGQPIQVTWFKHALSD